MDASSELSTSPMVVSVIIPVYNDTERLARCLQALAQQSYPADRFEIIVVDNGSTPPAARTLAPQHPCVVFAREPTPGSYAARNRGIELAKGTVIAFTDSDCIPSPDWIESGVAALSATPNCGLVAGRIDLFFANAARPTAAELYERVSGFPQEKYVVEFHFGATANVFTSASVIRIVGPFNPNLRSGGDLEWGERVHRAGYAQIYAPAAVVTHPARASLRDLVYKRRRTTSSVVWHMRQNQRFHGRAHWARTVLRVIRPRIVPPRAELAALWRDRRLTRTSERVKVVLVGCLMSYAYAYEFARIALGGVPKR
jgi:glycosyltransferase involved in cell wall biosynthesis